MLKYNVVFYIHFSYRITYRRI